ncbi:discoidin domain-containing protein [Pseudoduganella sp. LjRoot289]|uniref:glycoside hydrolase family 2 protein n=1 Tax=Pseudoduganella sp. LjRoot289 TaxID=3342314 RepID=UPI003ECE1B6E
MRCTILRFHRFFQKHALPLLAILLLALPGAAPQAAGQPREIIDMNRAWQFTLGDPKGAMDTAFDDSRWDVAHLPHSFSTPYFLGTGFYVGYGWYRKTISVPPAWRGKRLNLEFDGVFQDAEIFVNGQNAGRHRGGYTGFSIDITPHARPGANTIAVRVNNLWDARLSPRAGEHVFSGGIYRDVRLVLTEPVHVSWYGTFVQTPQVSKERATLTIETEVGNATAQAQSMLLVSSVYSPSGKLVTSVRSRRAVPAGASATILHTPPPVARPELWQPGRPAMYSLKSEVYVDGKLADVFTTPFGIRSIKWTADSGFFLNGEHVYLVGANVHQDQAGWGDAVTRSASRRDVKMIKDAGFNFIRGSHYPHSPAFSQATDELGMLFWSEAPFWGIGGFSADPGWLSSAYPPKPEDRPEFEASVLAQSAEMIRIHRNHPSIVVWSNGNETFFSAPEAMGALREFTKRQVALMRKLDPSRPVAIGGSQRGEIDKLGDIAGYNGDGAALYLNPGVASVVSEYGSTITDRPGAYEPGWGNLSDPPDQQGSTAAYPWRYKWRSGEAIWAGFDHGSIAAIEFGSMGMVDYFRIPKRQYYWYRKQYAGVPPPAWPVPGTPARLDLSADKTVIRGTQGHDDVHLLVTVKDKDGRALSNSPDVTLAIESGPGAFPTGRSITFSGKSLVAIRDGQAAINFRSYYAGKARIRATSPGLSDAVIEIDTDGPDPYVEGSSPLAKPMTVATYLPAKKDKTQTAVNVSLNRPTSASAAVAGSSARLANDGQDSTQWQSSAEQAVWSVDLENIYDVRSIGIDGPAPGTAFVVESSLDRLAWSPVGKAEATQAKYALADFAAPVKARFMRIRFLSLPAGAPATVKEFEVYAVPAN